MFTYLANDVLVGESDDQSVFRCVVLVLLLYYQTATSIVIGLSLPPPSELNLKALEVRFIFYNLHKSTLKSIQKCNANIINTTNEPVMQYKLYYVQLSSNFHYLFATLQCIFSTFHGCHLCLFHVCHFYLTR